jgi:tight adherence protein B
LAFTQMVGRTGLDITAPRALLGILTLGVGLSAALVFWRSDFALGILGLFLGIVAPLATLLLFQSRWRRQLQEQLPSALYVLARGLRAGQSLEQSIAMVGKRGNQPLAGQFQLCADQMALGLSAAAAVERAAKRIRLADFDVLVTLLRLHRETGGNLTLLLERIAAGARDRNQFRLQVRASTSLSRITATFIGGVVPTILLYYLIVQPDYVYNFMVSPEGAIALLVTIVLEIIGVIWIVWLLRTDF